MKEASSKPAGSDPVEQAAAEWVLRHDRGLTAAEQDELSQWLAADARHGRAWAEHHWGWDELDRLIGVQSSVHAAPDPDLLAPRRARRNWFLLSPARSLSALAAAIALTAGVVLWQRPRTVPGGPVIEPQPLAWPALALIEQRELADGSVVQLNRGAEVVERFATGERRVQLIRGDAHFQVANDAWRPFVVDAAGVSVRAVGTAFHVRLDPTAVDVLVTEGRVQVAAEDGRRRAEDGARRTEDGGRRAEDGGRRTEDGGRRAEDGGPTNEVEGADAGSRHVPLRVVGALSPGTLVEAGNRVVISRAPGAPAPEVTTVSPADIEARLAWQPRLLDFTNAPLPEIVAEFNRRNPVQLVLGDAELHALRLSATFRSDNVEGFVRLMVSDFGMRAEWRGDGEVTLHKFSAPQKL